MQDKERCRACGEVVDDPWVVEWRQESMLGCQPGACYGPLCYEHAAEIYRTALNSFAKVKPLPLPRRLMEKDG